VCAGYPDVLCYCALNAILSELPTLALHVVSQYVNYPPLTGGTNATSSWSRRTRAEVGCSYSQFTATIREPTWASPGYFVNASTIPCKSGAVHKPAGISK